MDRDILLLPTNMSFNEFLRQPKHEGKIRHVVVVRDERVVGVLRVNTGIRQGLESAYTGVTLDDVASREFIIAHEEDIMFGVIGLMWQRGAMMVVVVGGNGEPTAGDVLGVITKEHVADSVALEHTTLRLSGRQSISQRHVTGFWCQQRLRPHSQANQSDPSGLGP